MEYIPENSAGPLAGIGGHASGLGERSWGEEKPEVLRLRAARVGSVVDLDDAVRVEVVVRIVAGIVEILHIRAVTVERIGRDGTVGNDIARVGVAVMVMPGAS